MGWRSGRLRARSTGARGSSASRVVCGRSAACRGPISSRSISAAELFLFPSLYEGFGLPVLEAMACGLPVVASSRSAVPEVVGDAGPVADPEDPDAFARAALSLLRDSAARDSARARGIERARSFGWDRTARETLAVYRRTLEAG